VLDWAGLAYLPFAHQLDTGFPEKLTPALHNHPDTPVLGATGVNFSAIPQLEEEHAAIARPASTLATTHSPRKAPLEASLRRPDEPNLPRQPCRKPPKPTPSRRDHRMIIKWRRSLRIRRHFIGRAWTR